MKNNEVIGDKSLSKSDLERSSVAADSVEGLSDIDQLERDMEFFESHYDARFLTDDELENLKMTKIKDLEDSYRQAIKDYPDMKQEHILDSKATLDVLIPRIKDDFSRYVKKEINF